MAWTFDGTRYRRRTIPKFHCPVTIPHAVEPYFTVRAKLAVCVSDPDAALMVTVEVVGAVEVLEPPLPPQALIVPPIPMASIIRIPIRPRRLPGSHSGRVPSGRALLPRHTPG